MDTVSPTNPAPAGSPPPTSIGSYRILDTLGEGGMGTVYLAEQCEPVQRRVALKLIKLGMDSRAIIARFEQERQALAMMQHEGIARVYDCGTTERGQPYFVMELVRGMPLNEYCEQRRLSLPERLGLLQQACAAVQHAHQKGVVHRDLKPGNVMVCDDGPRPQVKIIDFGLAKAMGHKLVAATLFTEAGQIIGTPEYMAPEQADLHNLDIDTRADVYSLGVMLYELLVGSLPFPGELLRRNGLYEMQRLLREVDPQRPSSRLVSGGQTAAGIASARRIGLGPLRRALKNDLDWVVLKALEKDRARRYESASALALDLQRFLDHEALVAGPPSAGYRLKKLMRRHRGEVAAAAALLLALAGGAVATLVQYKRAEQKAADAAHSEQVARDKAAEALREKERADQQAADLAQMVSRIRPLALRALHDRVVADEATLHPPWPARIPAMQAWLANADTLLTVRDELEQALARLEDDAVPPTAAELEADRRTHPEWGAFESLERRVAALRQAQRTRRGHAAPEAPVPGLSFLITAAAAGAREAEWGPLARRAEDLVARGDQPALALAYARAALDRAVAPDHRRTSLVTLARALVANGRDGEALDRMAAALRDAPAAALAALGAVDRDLRDAIEKSDLALATAEHELAALAARVNRRRTFRFASDWVQFLHGATQSLRRDLDTLAQDIVPAVTRRLRWAGCITALTRQHPNARCSWHDARAAIAAADGVVASRLYAGVAVPLRDDGVLGLVPIGMNPATKLWEFYELYSAWDGTSDPAAIEIPRHRADGSLEPEPTGIVFALLPGGTFTMGAQAVDPSLRNYAADANGQDWPHAVGLAPFLLARYELTQAQWARLWGGAADRRSPSARAGADLPVDRVDWHEATRALADHGLCLPTEAQWEYACRAGTTTPWTCPPGQLADFARLGGRGTAATGPVGPLRVGSLVANAFGLFDVHGNVAEWCQDSHGSYADLVLVLNSGDLFVGDSMSHSILGVPELGDGLSLANGDEHVVRGGDWSGPAERATSHARRAELANTRSDTIGLRAARRLSP